MKPTKNPSKKAIDENFHLSHEYCQNLPTTRRKRRNPEIPSAIPPQRKFSHAGTQTMIELPVYRNLAIAQKSFPSASKIRRAFISHATSGEILLEFRWQAIISHSGILSSPSNPAFNIPSVNLDDLDAKKDGLRNDHVIIFWRNGNFHVLSFGGQPISAVECAEDPIVTNNPYWYARSAIIAQGESAAVWPSTKMIISGMSLMLHYAGEGKIRSVDES